MPVSASVDHDKRHIQVVLEGRVALSELTDALDQLIEQDIMSYAKLFDATAADLAFSDRDIMALAARTRAYEVLGPRGPVALVATDDKTTNVLWRFMNLSGGERPLALFDRLRDGREWLSSHALPRDRTPT
jgi:hypothetical protein